MLDHLTDITISRPIAVHSDWLVSAWEFLTTPDHRVDQWQDRRQATLTAALLFTLMVFFAVGVGLGAPTLPTLILIVMSYALSRTRYFKLAAFIALFSLSLPPYAYLLMGQSPELMGSALSWLVVPVVMSALLLPLRGMLMLVMINITTLMGVKLIFLPELAMSPVLNTVGLLIVVCGVVSVNAIIHQQYIVAPQMEELRVAQRLLQRTNTELEAANHEVKTFAYIIVHDLRAPLVNMMGFMDEVRYAVKSVLPVLKDIMPTLTDEQQATLQMSFFEDLPEAIDYVDTSCNKMEYLIEQIMKLSRAGQREFRPECVGVKEIVREIITTKTFELERRNAYTTIGDLPDVIADQLAMEQVFTNLLDNAVKYLDPHRPGSIEIRGARDETGVTYHIKDNGMGIAKENYEHVFQPFRRAVTDQEIRGEGMGLPYVQALIQKHGGRVWFDSEVGTGTTFHFSIPHDNPLVE